MAILLIYGFHDMRHTGFPQVDSGQRDPREWGVTLGTRSFSTRTRAVGVEKDPSKYPIRS